MSFGKGKTKTYILTTILMIVVSFFAFGLANIGRAKDIPAVSASETGAKSADFVLSDGITLNVTASVKDEANYSSRRTFYKSTLGWSISAEPGVAIADTDNDTIWYLPRTTGYNGGLPTLRQFESWKNVTFRVEVFQSDGETRVECKTDGYKEGFILGTVQVPDDYSQNYSESTERKDYYGYYIDAKCTPSDENEDSDYISSIYYIVNGDSITCKVILKEKKTWPKKYKVSYEVSNAKYDDDLTDNNRFKWESKEKEIVGNYTALRIVAPEMSEDKKSCTVKLYSSDINNKESGTYENKVVVGENGYEFYIANVVVKIGENEVINSSNGSSKYKYTLEIPENGDITDVCENVTVIAYIQPKYKVSFQFDDSNAGTWNPSSTVVSSGATVEYNTTQEKYQVVGTDTYISYQLKSRFKVTSHPRVTGITENKTITVPTHKYTFEELPKISFVIDGYTSGASWVVGGQAQSDRSKNYCIPRNTYVYLGEASSYTNKQEFELNNLKLYISQDDNEYSLRDISLKLNPGYYLSKMTFRLDGTEIGGGANYKIPDGQWLSISASIDVLKYDFALGYTKAEDNNRDNTGAKFLENQYEVNGKKYLDITKNMSTQIDVANYTKLPTSDADLQAFFGAYDYAKLTEKSVFNGWLLDIQAIKRYGFTSSNSTKWTLTENNKSYWVEFQAEGGVITTLKNEQFLKVTAVKGYGGPANSSEDFNFNDIDTYSVNKFNQDKVETYTDNGITRFSMIIIPNWSMKYDVEFTMDNNSSKWSSIDENYEYHGIKKGGTNIQASDDASGTIKATFSLNTSSKMGFAYSSSGTAFTKGSAINANSSSSLTFKDEENNKFTVYNYGFDIVGYQISFKYDSEVYYLNVNKDRNTYTWTNSNNIGNIAMSSLYSATVKANKTLASMVEAINLWTTGDYTFAFTVITIQPIWDAVKIQLTGDFVGGKKEFKYWDNYSLDVGNLATTGKSIAYYEAGENAVVCDDGTGAKLPWMYTNIISYQYKTKNNNIFDFDNLYYSLELKKHEVDNIYKVNLINTSDGRLEDDGAGTDYVSGSFDNGEIVYYYTSWVSCTFNGYEGKPTENYANTFKGQVDNFENGIVTYDYTTNENNARKYYLRVIYLDSQGNKFIYLANDHLIGDLRLIKDYYRLISWRYNGADGKCNFTTKDYDGTIEGQKDVVKKNVEEDNIFDCGSDKWTINCDDGAMAGDLYLSAIYYREQYTLDVNTVANGFEGFYGYIHLELVDNGNVENNASYIIKFNDAGGLDMYKYIGKDAQNTEGSDVSKLRSSGWKLVNGEKTIIIYPGCEVKLSVYDQSQVTDMNINESFYDEMIGYRFAGRLGVGLTGKGSLTTGQLGGINGYSLVLDTVDKIVENNSQTILLKARYNGSAQTELVKLYDNDSIKADVTFEPINYSTTVEMLLDSTKVIGAGNIIITNNITNASGTYKSFDLELKRGSRFSIYYHAFAGFGLQTTPFSLNGVAIDSLDMDGNIASVANDQTYVLNLSGAWLRRFFYRNQTSYSASKEQDLGNLDINVEYITFSVNYVVYEENDYTTAISSGNIVYNWTLPDVLNWTMPCEALYESGQLVTYYMLINGNKYAILNAWGYQPRAVSEHTLLKEQYGFALKQNPVYNKQIDTDTLYSMVVTSAGVIVPVNNRTFTIVVEVSPIYEITMQIEPGKLMGAVAEDQPNDTNCSERSMTISNGVDSNNSKTLTVVSTSGSCIIYTHKGLSNSVSAVWNNKYYSSVVFTSNLGEEIASTFTVDGDRTIYANFIPTTLPLRVNYYYQNEGKYITEEQAKAYISNLQLTITRGELCGVTNDADGAHVVANDTITLSYTLDSFYYLNVLVNGTGKRMDANDQIKIETNDYESREILLTLVFSDRKKGQINLEILPDKTNGAVFHNEDLQAMENFANLYISGTNNGKQGSFMESLKVEIRLGTIPNGYRFIGVKQNYDDINTAWRLVGNTITITDGVCPADLTNDEFISKIAGTYYVLFQKVLINTKMELVNDNLDNYTYSINGNQAVKTDTGNLVLSAGSCSLNDTITLVRKSDLANEALIEFYYVNNGAEISIGTTSPATLKINEALITALTGKFTDNNKTITLKVRNIRKYNITFTVSEGAEYLNEIVVDNTKLDGNTTFVSQYINADSTANIKISSILKDKFTIAISGDKVATGDVIDTSISMASNRKIDVKITKNSFKLSTSENLYADIMELNNKTPHQLTGDDVVNKNADKNYLYNTEVKLDFLTSATTQGEKVQLTELHFADELLTFTFNMNWDGDLADTVKVADKDGNALQNVQVSKVNNGIQITYTLNGQQYVYKIQQTSTGAQLSFMGQGDAELNLTYTAIKLIENTTT